MSALVQGPNSLNNIVVLGSTGSIGVQALEVIRLNSDQFRAYALSCHNNIERFMEQIEAFRPLHVAIADETLYTQLKSKVMLIDPDIKVYAGLKGLQELASLEAADTVIVSIVGNAALLPTLSAIRSGKRIALANKEVLVTSGDQIMREVKNKGITLIPVDSEHSALFQSMTGNPSESIEKLILTASGGPFLDPSWTKARLMAVSYKEALKHPNWTMGSKITIDSATLMNKGLEVIEAKWLFDVGYDQIEVLVHKESIVHSMVQYRDSSVIAQLGLPDMKLPILYALSHPQRLPAPFPRLDLKTVGTLTFSAPDLDRFPCLSLAYKAGMTGGSATTVLNAANEALVELFLKDKIGFYDISRSIDILLEQHIAILDPTYELILEIDKETRQRVFSDFSYRQGVSI